MRAGMPKTLRLIVALAMIAATLVATQAASLAASPPATVLVFDDLEHGDPFTNGWFAFGGSVGGGGIDPNVIDLPPIDGGAASLQTGWGSGGTPGFFGGFGRTNPSDLSGTSFFNFWINPDAGQDYTLEINLQDDDNGDNDTPFGNPDDDEFQYNCVISPTGPCAVAGGGWQLVSIPLTSFFDDNSAFGGNGILDPVAVANGGNGQLINVVMAVISNSGADATFRTDYWTFSRAGIIDNFENGLGTVTACPSAPIVGFCTFNDSASTVTIGTTSSSAPLPGAAAGNNVLSVATVVDADNGFAGAIHGFADTQDWSTAEGFSFWLYGNGTGKTLFVDILDNRVPGSTTDTAERFSIDIIDDFLGWQFFEIPFSSFGRKEVGNGAPNDGFTLTEIHGWAFGVFASGQDFTNYLDDVSVFGTAEPPALAVNLSQQNTLIEEGTTGDVAVTLNRPMGPSDPAQVSIDFATERSNAIPGEEFTPTSGTLTFTNGGATELFFEVETFDDTKFEGDEQIVIRLTNPVDVERGSQFQGSVLIDDNEPFDPRLLDDFEQGAFLWDTEGPIEINAVRVEASDPDARPGQDAIEKVGVAAVPLSVDISVQASVCDGRSNAVVPVELLSTADFDATTVDQATVTFGNATEVHVNKKTGVARRHVEDVNDDGLSDLVFHFRRAEIDAGCEPDLVPFNGFTFHGEPITAGGSDAAVLREFPIGQDWTGSETLDFWYYGAGGGQDVMVTLKDNRAPDLGPSGWTLAWADEFDDPAGTPPNPANWVYEIGDTTPDGKNGWGNDELQYYTDDNAATDGNGNLVITLDEADPGRECYYGPCEFESARLLTQNRAEFAYGRIESRLQVPTGGNGLWPAFWSLGTDITYNPWPGAGEIDFMEYVSRLPDEIFGTIHGPGYNGGLSYSGIYDDFGGVDGRVDQEYHTFAVEWEPNLIVWYVDGIEYHRAEPSDVAPFPWMFDKPFFLLLNFAIGGNFGGDVDPGNVYPQEYLVDYVRVYQGTDTAERFEATFTDSVDGWQEISILIDEFVRSDNQPAGAPNDGLGLDEVWGYGFALPDGNASGEVKVDLVRRVPEAPTGAVTVIDDFEDGTAADWGFFGGNAAGGVGGVRPGDPKEGLYYFSTGWGGLGSNSGFYGGAFTNFDNDEQVTPPAVDPWFNVWVRNRAVATADEYRLEITIREDLDGNGWTDGAEDSFRLDTTFPSSSFDNGWTLVSAHLSDFTNLGTGGDGTFDGSLDEVVIVLAGVVGADGSTIAVDFDLFAFSSGGPLPG